MASSPRALRARFRSPLPLREPPPAPVLPQAGAQPAVGQVLARPAPDRLSPERLAPPEPGAQERREV
jgi:hypothetical protein